MTPPFATQEQTQKMTHEKKCYDKNVLFISKMQETIPLNTILSSLQSHPQRIIYRAALIVQRKTKPTPNSVIKRRQEKLEKLETKETKVKLVWVLRPTNKPISNRVEVASRIASPHEQGEY